MTLIIGLLVRAFGLDEKTARLAVWGAALALLAAVAGIHAVSATWARANAVSAAHEAGVAAGEASEREKWRTAADVERQRQARANAEAVAASEQTAAALRRERDDLAQTIEDLTHAADADPDHDRQCLDAGSVRALDALR